MNIWNLFVPDQAAGAALEYFDLFNATGSAHKIIVFSVQPVVSAAVAVTGVVAVDLFLLRTTDVGTGGTAATVEGSDITKATISSVALTGALPEGITARITPTGGATDGAILGHTSVFTEETNAGTYAEKELVKNPITINQDSGIMVFQGGVASVGNIGVNVSFGLIPL